MVQLRVISVDFIESGEKSFKIEEIVEKIKVSMFENRSFW